MVAPEVAWVAAVPVVAVSWCMPAVQPETAHVQVECSLQPLIVTAYSPTTRFKKIQG